MSPEAAERLQELIEERDSLRRRIAAALRDEVIPAYSALALGCALIALVLWDGAKGGMPALTDIVIAVFIAAVTAIVYYAIRQFGLSFIINIPAWFSYDENEIDDPIAELRERLADCERRISAMRASRT